MNKLNLPEETLEVLVYDTNWAIKTIVEEEILHISQATLIPQLMIHNPWNISCL